MGNRFFSTASLDPDQTILLDGAEGRHLARVMRARPGDRVTLFNGSGGECLAEVTQVGRDGVELVVRERTDADRELPFELCLGVALPKGDRQKWLIEKAAELGVSRIVPLRTERGVAQPSESAIERMRRWVVEATKQCGRNQLMNISAPQDFSDYVASTPAAATRWVAHPERFGGQSPPSSSFVDGCYLAVGPEGGFSEQEASTARAAGWNLVDLGPRILRVETAAIALAARVAFPDSI